MKNANDHHTETAIERAHSAHARAQAKSPTAQKVRISSYQDFAKLVSTTPKSFDPERSNVVIHNRGSETWQLVKAADGSRIRSIVYSSESPVQQSRLATSPDA